MDAPVPSEALFTGDPSLVLLVLAVLVVVLFVGRFLLNLAWRLVLLTTAAVVAFYLGTVVLPTVLGMA